MVNEQDFDIQYFEKAYAKHLIATFRTVLRLIGSGGFVILVSDRFGWRHLSTRSKFAGPLHFECLQKPIFPWKTYGGEYLCDRLGRRILVNVFPVASLVWHALKPVL